MPHPAAAPRPSGHQRFWYEIGNQTAATYLNRREWLYRRVESIEFVGRRSVRRRVSVDFEIPPGLPPLDDRARKDGKLVPVAAFPKQPFTGFDLIGPDEHPTSLYMGDTSGALDLGLLVGLAETVVPRASPEMANGFSYITSHEQPDDDQLATLLHPIELQFKKAVGRIDDEEEQERAFQRARETMDLAGRLGNSSLLWTLVTGTPGTDRIIKFSYLEPREDTNRQWKRVLIGCSWWQRRIDLSLPHAGLHTRYHLDVLPPAPGLVLKSAEVLALSGPLTLTPTTAQPAGGNNETTAQPAGENTETTAKPREYSRIRDGRAIFYRGYRDAPSHRLLLRLIIAASREGFITGCVISAAVIAALMTVTFLGLSSADVNIDATVVLLAAVPVVLGYVLVRPGETAFERYHLVGVRAMALLSGVLPIIGAVTLMLTHGAGASSSRDARNVWAALLILSLLLTLAVAMSWFHAVSPETGEQITDTTPPRASRRMAPLSAILFASAVVAGSVLESQPYSHVARRALAAYLVHNRLRVLGASLIAGLGAVALYGLLVGAWQGLVPRATGWRVRQLFRWLVVYPGVAWIWVTVALLALTAWLTITVSHGRGGERLAWFSPVIDVAANATLAPAAIVVVATTTWLAWRADLLHEPLEAGLVLVGEAALAAVVLIGARAVSSLWPSVVHVAPSVAWIGLAIWVAIAGTVPRLRRRAPS